MRVKLGLNYSKVMCYLTTFAVTDLTTCREAVLFRTLTFNQGFNSKVPHQCHIAVHITVTQMSRKCKSTHRSFLILCNIPILGMLKCVQKRSGCIVCCAKYANAHELS